MLAARQVDTIINRPSNLSPYIQGRLAAWRLAGSWPEAGDLRELAEGCSRADDALSFARRLEVRWHCRWRIWAHRDKWTESERQLDRLKHRIECAKEIADARSELLSRLLRERAGNA